MKQTQETVDVFYSEDGKRFLDKSECEKHESLIQKTQDRVKRTKFFIIPHAPDLTEGRGFNNLLWLAVENPPSNADISEAAAQTIAFQLFGIPLGEGTMGVGLAPHWILRTTPMQDFDSRHDSRRHSGYYNEYALFISDNPEPLEGWPKPVEFKRFLGKKITDLAVFPEMEFWTR